MPLNPQIANTLRGMHSSVNEDGIVFGNPKHPHVTTLTNGGLIAAHADKIDPSNPGKHGYSLTAAGLAELGLQPVASTDGAPVTQVAASKRGGGKGSRGPNVVPVIVAATGRMALPTDFVKRGGNRGETYAFGKLEAPATDESGHPIFDSFFVQATEEMPEPANTVRAAITSANKRYSDRGIKFKHFIMTNDPQTGLAGVRVFRLS